jgi:DNA modification methylase
MKTLPDKSIDLILTDPPYGIGISSNPFRGKFQKKDWDSVAPTKEYFQEMARISKHQVIWGGNYFTYALPPNKCFFIWDKIQPEQFSSAMCEYAWVSKDMPAKLFRKRVTAYIKYHPTTKPLELLDWCIKFFPEAKNIFDPFMGSGSVLLSAQRMGLDYSGCEIDKEYFQIAEKRIQTMNGELFKEV